MSKKCEFGFRNENCTDCDSHDFKETQHTERVKQIYKNGGTHDMGWY